MHARLIYRVVWGCAGSLVSASQWTMSSKSRFSAPSPHLLFPVKFCVWPQGPSTYHSSNCGMNKRIHEYIRKWHFKNKLKNNQINSRIIKLEFERRWEEPLLECDHLRISLLRKNGTTWLCLLPHSETWWSVLKMFLIFLVCKIWEIWVQFAALVAAFPERPLWESVII